MGARGVVKVAVLIGLIGGALALPATAGAYGGWYCGSLKASGNWCGWPDGAHTWEYNAAQYTGSPPIFVCQRLWDPANNLAYGQTCGYGFTDRIYYPNHTWGAHVEQLSGGNHTVWGFATTNRCEVINCGTPALYRRTHRSRASQLAGDGLAPPPGASPVQVVSDVPSGIAGSFGVFGRQRSAGDVPRVGSVGSVQWGQWSRLFGANVQLARRARVSSRDGLFLLPGRGAVCLSLVAGVEGMSTCASLAEAQAGRLIGSAVSSTGDENLVYGAVPDDVARVTITTKAGRDVSEAVVDNGYLTALAGEPVNVAYTVGGRRVVNDVPYPSSP
jgi:hypothetical protein